MSKGNAHGKYASSSRSICVEKMFKWFLMFCLKKKVLTSIVLNTYILRRWIIFSEPASQHARPALSCRDKSHAVSFSKQISPSIRLLYVSPTVIAMQVEHQLTLPWPHLSLLLHATNLDTVRSSLSSALPAGCLQCLQGYKSLEVETSVVTSIANVALFGLIWPCSYCMHFGQDLWTEI